MKNIAKKNQLIITTLAIMIAVAGFLNYSGKENLKDKSAAASGKTGETSGESVDVADLSEEDIYVQAQNAIAKTDEIQEETLQEELPEVIESLDNDPSTGESVETAADISAEASDNSAATPGEAVLANSTAMTTIADLKLTREQTRSKNKETLLEIVNSTTVTDAQKQNAVDEMVNLTDISEKEAAAEILLQAKGFSDVVVNIENNTVDVIVNVAELDDVSRAQIEDIVKRKTGISGENIVITTLNSKK